MEEKEPEIGDYYIGRTIGLGSQAKVKIGRHKTTNQKVALKIIKKKNLESSPDKKIKLQREISLMRIFDHPHLLKLIDVYETETHFYLVLEYAKHGELFDYIVERGCLSAQCALSFFRQIISALDFLHMHNICHRDIKPENILLDSKDRIKIADFGFARWMKSNVTSTSCGSPHYAAPEVIKGDPYDGKCADIWSTGVLFYTLLCVCFYTREMIDIFQFFSIFIQFIFKYLNVFTILKKLKYFSFTSF